MLISKEGLHEVYLINRGEQNIINPVEFSISWPDGIQPFYDILDQYKGDSLNNKLIIKGPAPKTGNRVLVAWFRDSNVDNKSISFEISEVSLNEKF